MILIEIVSGIEIDGHIGNSVLSAAASDVLTARNAQLPVSWSWSAAPSGVTPTAAGDTLTIARTNAAAGSFALTVTAIDARGYRRVRTFAWAVQALPLQVTGTLSSAEVGTAYSASLSVSGGVTPYASATVITGPAWMTASVSGTTVTLGGTPTAGAGGTVTIRVMDADSVTRDYTATLLWVDLTLTGDYPDAGVGTSYSHDLTIAGGNGIYSNPRVTSGSLAGSGLSLSIVGDKLRLSGTTGSAAATYTFTAAVDSGDGQTATSVQSVSVAVATAPVYIPGYFNWDGITRYMGRISASLVLDSWNPPSTDAAGSQGILVANADDWVYSASGSGYLHRFAVTDGAIDSIFNPGYGNGLFPLWEATDGDVVMYVGAGTIAGVSVGTCVCKVSTSGVLDSGATLAILPSNGRIYGSAEDGSGGHFVWGTFTSIGGISRAGFAHIDSTGAVDSLWPDIGTGTTYGVKRRSCSVDSSGGVWVALGGTCKRYLSDGTLDVTVTPSGGDIYSVAAVSTGKVYVAGTFSAIGGVSRNALMRLNSDGTPDSSFNSSVNADARIDAIMLQTDARLFVSAYGTSMTTIGGESRKRFAIVDDTGAEISGWTVDAPLSFELMAQ